MASEISDWIAAASEQECELANKLKKVEHYYIQCSTEDEKYEAVSFIVKHGYGPGITYCQSSKTAKWLVDKLTEDGLSSILHGENASTGDSINQQFRDNVKVMVVTTDRLAKGAKFDNVTVVVNYDPPIDGYNDEADCETYLRRLEGARNVGSSTTGKMGRVISLAYGFTSMYIVKSIRQKFRMSVSQLKTEDIKQLFQSGQSSASH